MKRIVLFLFTICFSGSLFAADPTHWTYEVKKKSATEYELIFHLKLEDGWHIWALKPGGDGFQIAPSFEFDKNAAVQLKGAVVERGKPVVEEIKGIDGKVTYFKEQVDFVQLVTVKGHPSIKGKHGYQVCNDQICLPPKDKEFVFNIK